MAGEDASAVGTISIALSHAANLLNSSPDLAARQADEILKASPGHPQALMLLGGALRRTGDLAAAEAVLTPLAREQVRAPQVHLELGMCLMAAGNVAGAITALKHSLNLKPQQPEAWRTLADLHLVEGDGTSADRAYAQSIRWSTEDPALMDAALALADDRLAPAEHALKDRLKSAPTDVAAIRMLAEVAGRLGRYGDSETLLRRALELAPSFTAARHNLAIVLYRQAKVEQALEVINVLLAESPNDPNYRNLKAGALARVGDLQESINVYGKMLKEFPNQPMGWLSYGHALKTAGRTAEGIEAYRRSIQQRPSFGDAYWSLANLKTFRFEASEVEAMRQQLMAGSDLSIEDRFHLHFALGKALEDAKAFEDSFHHYDEGNRLRRSVLSYDPDETTAHKDRCKSTFTRELMVSRKDQGCSAPDPIFILGLPRSGSTLIEQILDSHSLIEGTAELPDIGFIARVLGERKKKSQDSLYPEIVADLSPERLRELGESFMETTRIQRKTDKPFFIDKLPNNFIHVGLIQLILPKAKIIDARRHPLGTCFSGFKQHFARGQNFSYGLTDIGRYYADYVELMAHFDAVTPGKVHRVIYEDMVADTEAEVRRLLDYCGVAFEERCLRFYENDRAVRTASSEQVRNPIFKDAVEHWKNYEPWLDPMKSALGPVLDAYPSAPTYS
jgi:tetratricopeptide (TPR) repeat protein